MAAAKTRRAPSADPDRGGADEPDGSKPATVTADSEAVRGATMIEVSDLTVRFGGVTPLDGMSVRFENGTCGLIGPNGAGKTTFFNVLSGFVKPAGGTVTAFGEDLLGMAHFRRARWGVRRTFQTEQAIEELSVYDNVAMIHEHSKRRCRLAPQDVLEAISFVGLEVDPDAKRRHVGAARPPAGRGRARGRRPPTAWCCSTSPPPGFPTRRPTHLGEVIRRIPEHTGALTILVDHDMSLVSACCAVTAVLDFGKLIASGPTAEVLRDERVVRAYLGTERA